MTHRYAFEAVDRSLRDVMRFSNDGDINQPFGGKVVVFGDAFRQILPVIPNKGSRSEIVNVSLHICGLLCGQICGLLASYFTLYDLIKYIFVYSYKVLKLTKNMRLRGGDSCSELGEIKEFSEWILKVGDGVAGDPNDGEVELELPNDMLIQHTGDPIASIVDVIYPSLENQLSNPEYLQERAILSPTHEIVDLVNDYVLSQIDGTKKIYFSSDDVSKNESNIGVRDLYSTEFLNSIKCSGLPNHELKLKVGYSYASSKH
ncbi:uncharacterized protein LOC141641854 [Silene latifolia]|uniref:uncharacterized protein LOC141641854 n=1 Tax=Silene latifolia TaxID=37657 RepID=UPI003D77AB43